MTTTFLALDIFAAALYLGALVYAMRQSGIITTLSGNQS